MVRHSLWAIVLATCCSMSAAGEPALPAAAGKLDVKKMPVNKWIARPLSGWAGKIWYGSGLPFGFCSAGKLGITVFDAALLKKSGHIKDLNTAHIRTLDLAAGAWTEHASGPVKHDFLNRYKHPVMENLHGMALCYDSDRKVLMGLTTTGLDGRGRTMEFDLKTKQHSGFKPEPSPPVVTTASLCYDPINKEVVLATGGFSPVGGTEGTWLYDGAKKQWRKLETPQEVDAVRLPLEKLRDRLVGLRWLAWKNLEFRATGREKLLDKRSKTEALGAEAKSLHADFGKLVKLAAGNSAKAGRAYHRKCLAVAAKQLEITTGKLASVAAALKSGSPEEIERLYRSNLLPALAGAERAIFELAVTPEPRMSSRLVYDSKNKLIVCYGGDGQCRSWDDTWVYHCQGRWWERRRPSVRPPAMESRALAFDARNGLVVFLQAKRWNGRNERLWIYDVGGNWWKRLDIARPAGAFWLEYDPNSGCLVALDHDMRKAWALRLEPGLAKVLPVTARAEDSCPQAAPTGKYVLRDAATLGDIKKWKAEQDAWSKSVAANTWVKVPTRGSGRPNWGRTWSSIVLDPDRRQIYYRDGGHGSYHGSDTDHYDIPTGRWFRSDHRYVPPWPMGSYFGWGRSFSYAPWAVHTYKYNLFMNPLRKRLQRVLGQSGLMAGAGPGSLLEYDPDTGRWARGFQSLEGATGGAFGGGVVVPGLSNSMLSINNFSRYGVKDGSAALITKDGAKEMKNLGRLPRAYNDHNFCWFFDSKRKRAMFYGGGMKKGKGKPPELYALDVTAANSKWQKLELKPGKEGKAGNGLPHYTREIVYVPKHDRFLMIGGLVGYGYKGPPIIWELDVKAGTWRKLKLKAAGGKPPKHGGVSIGLQYDPVTDLVFYIAASGGTPTMYAFRYAPK
jgi:hypothetical protein